MRHGTRTSYNHDGCRCRECSEANAEFARLRRIQRKTGRVLIDGRLVHPLAQHGTRSGYSNWSCRCEACVAANRRTHAEWRRRSA